MKDRLILLPGESRQSQADDALIEQLHYAEMAMDECRKAFLLLLSWHKTKKSRSSQDCKSSMAQALHAANHIGVVISTYTEKRKMYPSPTHDTLALIPLVAGIAGFGYLLMWIISHLPEGKKQ